MGYGNLFGHSKPLIFSSSLTTISFLLQYIWNYYHTEESNLVDIVKIEISSSQVFYNT